MGQVEKEKKDISQLRIYPIDHKALKRVIDVYHIILRFLRNEKDKKKPRQMDPKSASLVKLLGVESC
ncbi:hypothetical protein DRO61_02085 [Candidatus Bathyarchaeota archaeon]|nr:MAG: hypothetical protein DRO61_02085 [Candidatus Bathyarchaeota archaeon]